MTFPTKFKSYDAVIIGARCAGAATGMLLARAGAKVLIVDREPFLGDTLSTHAIMRSGTSLLARWGLLDGLLESTPAIVQTQFQYGQEVVTIPIKPTDDMPGLIAPRRWVLDAQIVSAAKTAGADVFFGMSFCDVQRDAGGAISGVILQDRTGTKHVVETQMVIGADGRNSSVAEKVGAVTHMTSSKRAAAVCTYLEGLPNDGYRWFYDEGRYGGIIPTSHGQTCVFAGCRPQSFKDIFAAGTHIGLSSLFDGWDAQVVRKLSEFDVAEKPKIFLGANGHLKQRVGPGWALVGDAAFFKDPATAHGISDAFLDAQRLSDAIVSNPQNLQPYAVDRDALSKPLLDVTQKIASLDWDLNQLQSYHHDLSQCMKSEQRSLPAEAHAIAA